MKVLPPPITVAKTYAKKNEDMKRVMSPHLTIYKSELTSIMSITVRLTGFSLGILAWILFNTQLFSTNEFDFFIDKLKELQLEDRYWTGLKICMAFPFSFHFVAGLRHLMFDTSKLMEKSQYYVTGYLAMTVSLLLAVFLGLLPDLCAGGDEEEPKLKITN